MPELVLIRGEDPAALLRAAAGPLLAHRVATAAEPFPTPAAWLWLRQGGLRDDVIALAREAGHPGWFDPPIRVFGEVPRLLGVADAPEADDLVRLALLERLLREPALRTAFGPRGPAFAASVDRALGELLSGGATPERFRAAAAAARAGDAFESRRDAALAELLARYLAELDAAGLRDPRAGWQAAAALVRRQGRDLAERLGGRREIRIVGLMDLRLGWDALLAALAESPALDRILVYSNQPLALPAREERLPPRGEAPVRALRSAPDPAREAELVAARVRALADDGVPPARIAIVAREARPALDLARDALLRAGLPVRARRRVRLGDVAAVRAVRALVAAAADGWTRHALVELAEQPYLATGLDAARCDAAGRARPLAGLDAWCGALADPAMDDFAARVRALDVPAPLGTWLARVATVLDDAGWRLDERVEDGGRQEPTLVLRDRRALERLRERLAGWRAALARHGAPGEPLDAAAFLERLDGALDDDLAWPEGPAAGVQLLEAHAAAYRAFDHVFVVGLASGVFPAVPHRSPLLHAGDLERLAAAGLPFEARGAWLARERELFREVTATARETLTLSWPRTDLQGAVADASAFVRAEEARHGLVAESWPASRVLVDGMPCAGTAGLAHAAATVPIERARRAPAAHPWNGRLEAEAARQVLAGRFGEDHVWHPSRLERYAHCPWAFLAEELLGVERRGEPEEGLERRVAGSVRHAALRAVYDRLAAARGGAPVYLLPGDLADATALVPSAVDAALAAATPADRVPGPADAIERARLIRQLERLLAAEAEEHAASSNSRKGAARLVRTGVVEHEIPFGPHVLRRAQGSIRVRGTLDRLETSIEDRVGGTEGMAALVEYKSSMYATPAGGKPAAWEDGVAIQLPLYVWALGQQRPATPLARAEYRELRRGESPHRVQPWKVRVTQTEAALLPDEEAARKLDAALDHAVAHAHRIRDGHFPADPPPSCSCPGFCPSRDICRVPGGPRGDR